MTARFHSLICSFPTLKWKVPVPAVGELFSPEQFALACAPLSSGERDAALFVLSVFNPDATWKRQRLDRDGTGRFNMHYALGNWDRQHREAFVAWARDPFWM